ncbi:MAG: synthase delta subunit [Candidatus Saccharibacteria bacterium]|nr:synthase delta subunit [Candidatus Saccharibacteria bacterium]
MAQRLSRRLIAQYVARELTDSEDAKKLLQEVAGYLVESRRTSEIDLLVRDIEYELAERGHIRAEVTTAYPLGDALRQSTIDLIKQQTAATAVSLDETVDEAVLGGMRISLPGRELDQTVRTQLLRLETTFKA